LQPKGKVNQARIEKIRGWDEIGTRGEYTPVQKGFYRANDSQSAYCFDE
jgi:aerobic-type carbon monoxide dehydrogenase small subunit (CoxS/CutS family)